MIRVVGLRKSYGTQEVLSGINLHIAKGKIVALLGESGSGKSVLLRHMIGLEKPDAGKVFINKIDITQLPENKLLPIRKDIGYLFQSGALYDSLTVRENVAFPLREHTNWKWKDIWAKTDGLLNLVGLYEARNKLPSALSGGMNKRAALARAVVLDSKILLCDEPTSGLDPIKSQEMTDLIKEVSRHIGSTTVVTSHDMHNAFRIADRLILLKDRRIVLEGTAEDFYHSDKKFVQKFLNVAEV